MIGNILFIFVLWGPCAILGWQKSSHFPYLALAYVLALVFGIGMLFYTGDPTIWFPFSVAVCVLYPVSGGFYWLHEEADPEIIHFDWKTAIFGP